MVESFTPYPPLFIGQTFESIEDGRAAVLEAIVAHGQSFKVASSNQKRWRAICRFKEDTGCNFQIRIAYIDQSDKIKLQRLILHTCDLSLHFG